MLVEGACNCPTEKFSGDVLLGWWDKEVPSGPDGGGPEVVMTPLGKGWSREEGVALKGGVNGEDGGGLLCPEGMACEQGSGEGEGGS